MKKGNLFLVAVLVGAIGLAPTELPRAQAGATATTSAPGLQVSTKQYAAVAGASPSATTAAAYAIPAFTTCSVSNQTTGANNSPRFVINMTSVTGYVVGMKPSGPAGIPASALITVVDVVNKRITISVATTANIGNNSVITGNCWQQYFSVNNTQTTALTSFGIQQTFGSISPDTVAMQSCSGTWTEGTGACSGSITTIVSGTVTSAITTVPIALAVQAPTGTARLRLMASTSGVSVTISVFIRRAIDVAAGSESNS